jgi:hypothetical protein
VPAPNRDRLTVGVDLETNGATSALWGWSRLSVSNRHTLDSRFNFLDECRGVHRV